MKKAERLETILRHIERNEGADVAALSAETGVSEVTIRKDLQLLELQGRIVRSYGQVALANAETALEEEMVGEAQIARLAAGLVRDEDLIFIGPGKTCRQFAMQLHEKKRLSVITMNVSAAMELSEMPEYKLLLMPGDFTRRNGTHYVTGAETVDYAGDLYVDKAFITADGFDLERGFSVLDEVTAQIYRALIKPCTRVCVFVTAARFSRNARAPLGGLALASAVVTDQRPGDEYLAAFEKQGIRVYYPETECSG